MPSGFTFLPCATFEKYCRRVQHGLDFLQRRACLRELETHLLSLFRAVMLATMTLSGLGDATALKVPFQNFSKSSFSSSCDPRDREGRQWGS